MASFSEKYEKLFSWFHTCTEEQVDRLFRLLFLLTTVFGIAIVRINALDLSADEAHYWEWSRHLDLSYYSKGPGIACLIRLGTLIGGTTDFGVRLGAILCFSTLSALLYFVLRALNGAHAALITWLLFRSSLGFSFTNYIITTDSPTLLFWFAAIACGVFAIRKNQPWWWLGSLLAIGLTILFKYTAVLLGMSAVGFLVFSQSHRRALISKGFLLGVIAAAICVAPIILWNAQHQWVNFAHNAGHVVSGKTFSLKPQYVIELVAGQLALVGPLLLPLLAVAIVSSLQDKAAILPERTFLLWTILPLLALCFVTALTKRVYANWPLPAYLGMLFLFAGEFRELVRRRGVQRLVVGSIAVNSIVLFTAHLFLSGLTFGVPPKFLPTKKLAGWETLGTSVEEFMRGRPDGDELFILTSRYEDASAIAFYNSKHPDVFCANNGMRRMNQYDIWDGWQRLKGRSALIVLRDKEVPAAIREHFVAIEPLADWLAVLYGGQVLREYNFFIGTNYDGYSPPLPNKY